MLDALHGLPEIATERLVLRGLDEADAAAVQAISDNPTILEGIVFLKRPFTVEAARALLAPRPKGQDRFIGAWLKDGRLAGVLGCHLQGPARAEIGYWIWPELHGRGYASEAARGLVGFLRREAPGRMVVARAFESNTGSVKVLRKLGFVTAEEAGAPPEPWLYVLAESLVSQPG